MGDVFVTPDQHVHAHSHSSSPLAAYNYKPSRIKFVGTDEKEKVILLLRRHPITNVRWIGLAVLMVLAPLFISMTGALDFVPVRFQLVGILMWYLITTAFIFEEFLGWYFHVFIITDERVFDVDFVNLAYREISECNIDQIQDVTVRVGGVLRTLFRFGDVYIQTASENPQIEFEAVPNPDGVSKILRELRVEEEQEKLEGRVR